MQELHEADLAASVAQQQLTHERQRTGRLKQAIKSAFEDARTPAAGLTGGLETISLVIKRICDPDTDQSGCHGSCNQ